MLLAPHRYSLGEAMHRLVLHYGTRAFAALTGVLLLAAPLAAQLKVSNALLVFVDGDGDVGLARQTPLGVTPDGTVWILAETREALYMVGRGSAARRVGRRGSGPGEYLRISSFGWLADTLWISDEGTSRITYLAEHGAGRVRTQPFIGAMTARAFMTQPLALSPDGNAICGLLPTGAVSGVSVLQTEPLARVARHGKSPWDTLLLLDVRHRTHEVMNGNVKITSAQLMSDATLWALSRNGKFSLHVDRSDEASASLRPTVVTVQHTDKRLLYRLELLSPRARTTRADVDRLVQAKVNTFNLMRKDDWIPPLSVAAYGRGMFVPRFRIAVTEAVLGDDGTALLRGNDWSSGAVRYTWIRPDGTLRGTFELPVRQYVRAVSQSWIWTVEEDDDGGARLIRQLLK